MSVRHPQNGRFDDFETENLRPLLGMEIFFFDKLNSLLQFFGVKFT